MLRFSRRRFVYRLYTPQAVGVTTMNDTAPHIYLYAIRPVPSFYSKETIFLTQPVSSGESGKCYQLTEAGSALMNVSHSLKSTPRFIRSLKKHPNRVHSTSVDPYLVLVYKSPNQRFKPDDVTGVIKKACTICHVWQDNEWVKVPLDDSKESMKIWSTLLPTSITALSGEMMTFSSMHDRWKHNLINLEQNMWLLSHEQYQNPVSMLFFNDGETDYNACLHKMGAALNGTGMKKNKPSFLKGPLLACYLPFSNMFHGMKKLDERMETMMAQKAEQMKLVRTELAEINTRISIQTAEIELLRTEIAESNTRRESMIKDVLQKIAAHSQRASISKMHFCSLVRFRKKNKVGANNQDYQ